MFDEFALPITTTASVSRSSGTATGLLQRESTSVYVSGETRSRLQFNAGVTSGPYRAVGAHPGEWVDMLKAGILDPWRQQLKELAALPLGARARP